MHAYITKDYIGLQNRTIRNTEKSLWMQLGIVICVHAGQNNNVGLN